MNPKGYLGAAEAYVGANREEEAIDVLETGYEMTGDESIQSALDDLKFDMEDTLSIAEDAFERDDLDEFQEVPDDTAAPKEITILLNSSTGLEITLSNYYEKCERSHYKETGSVNSIAFFIHPDGAYMFNQNIILEDNWSDSVIECRANVYNAMPEYCYLYLPDSPTDDIRATDQTDYGALLLLPSNYYEEDNEHAVLRFENVSVENLQ